MCSVCGRYEPTCRHRLLVVGQQIAASLVEWARELAVWAPLGVEELALPSVPGVVPGVPALPSVPGVVGGVPALPSVPGVVQEVPVVLL